MFGLERADRRRFCELPGNERYGKRESCGSKRERHSQTISTLAIIGEIKLRNNRGSIVGMFKFEFFRSPGVYAWARENATLNLAALQTLSEGTTRPDPGGKDPGSSE
jgi:hypothetical protein